MIASITNFRTKNAFDYLNVLCEHFAKRVPVEANEVTTRVTLPIGICDLGASDTDITARIQADPDHIDRMEAVFGGWIERIAFRENANLTWHRATHPRKD